jgi:uncharacterized membrane protein (UPF0127 family)
MQYRHFEPLTVTVFFHPEPGTFLYHMTNVPIDLDVVSISPTGSILSLCSMERETGSSRTPENTQFVIEAPKGWATRNRLRVGDRIQFGNLQ